MDKERRKKLARAPRFIPVFIITATAGASAARLLPDARNFIRPGIDEPHKRAQGLE